MVVVRRHDGTKTGTEMEKKPIKSSRREVDTEEPLMRAFMFLIYAIQVKITIIILWISLLLELWTWYVSQVTCVVTLLIMWYYWYLHFTKDHSTASDSRSGLKNAALAELDQSLEVGYIPSIISYTFNSSTNISSGTLTLTLTLTLILLEVLLTACQAAGSVRMQTMNPVINGSLWAHTRHILRYHT